MFKPKDMLGILVTKIHTHIHTHPHVFQHTLPQTYTACTHRQLSLMLTHSLSHTHKHTQYDSSQQNVFAACSVLIWKLQTWDNVDPMMTVCLTEENPESCYLLHSVHAHTGTKLIQKQMYTNNPQSAPWHIPSNPKQSRACKWSVAYGWEEIYTHHPFIFLAVYLWLIRVLHPVTHPQNKPYICKLMVQHIILWCLMSASMDLCTHRWRILKWEKTMKVDPMKGTGIVDYVEDMIHQEKASCIWHLTRNYCCGSCSRRLEFQDVLQCFAAQPLLRSQK